MLQHYYRSWSSHGHFYPLCLLYVCLPAGMLYLKKMVNPYMSSHRHHSCNISQLKTHFPPAELKFQVIFALWHQPLLSMYAVGVAGGVAYVTIILGAYESLYSSARKRLYRFESSSVFLIVKPRLSVAAAPCSVYQSMAISFISHSWPSNSRYCFRSAMLRTIIGPVTPFNRIAIKGLCYFIHGYCRR